MQITLDPVRRGGERCGRASALDDALVDTGGGRLGRLRRRAVVRCRRYRVLPYAAAPLIGTTGRVAGTTDRAGRPARAAAGFDAGASADTGMPVGSSVIFHRSPAAHIPAASMRHPSAPLMTAIDFPRWTSSPGSENLKVGSSGPTAARLGTARMCGGGR
jgi:hypothetical protein